MLKVYLLLILSTVGLFIFSQNSSVTAQSTLVQRPKLVVGIVVDQMRWDYLYRYNARYAENGGFKRLLSQGFSCENTLIPYAPTVTACGHTCIYTGSVPAISGITGNNWWDYNQNKLLYCTEDAQVKTIGSNTESGQMSPKNLLVTTIGDELRLATNFRSKVVGIAIKDRGAILPAGHSANGAYWYDSKTGDWISSNYYLSELPAWVKEFNAKKLVDKYYNQDWNTLYPLATYEQSAPNIREFPRNLKQYAGKNYSQISVTPYGNSFTFDMAKAAISGEQLGADSFTDLFTISLSSPDYIGHAYGPSSVEAEDGFLRLDKDLGDFLTYLDEKVGKGEWLVFLTADHGAANVPSFLNEHKIPAGNFDNEKVTNALNQFLFESFQVKELVFGIINYQVYLDRNAMKLKSLNTDAVYAKVIDLSEDGKKLKVGLKDETKKVRALHGLYRTLINNMVLGVSEQFDLTLILKGVGYRAVVEGKEIVLSLGYSHPVKIEIPKEISVEIIKNTTVNLKSCDKELLGLFASNIRAWRQPEPYKGKGILYKNEQIIRKAGKSGK